MCCVIVSRRITSRHHHTSIYPAKTLIMASTAKLNTTSLSFHDPISIAIDLGRHEFGLQKNPPLKKSPTKHDYQKKTIYPQKRRMHIAPSQLSSMPRPKHKKQKTGHGPQSCHPCILSAFSITPQSVELYDWIGVRRGPRKKLQQEKCFRGLKPLGRMCCDVTDAYSIMRLLASAS